jgi:tRNA(Arg) A34 adenosine deaminase TadA
MIENDERHMRRALALAEEAAYAGEVPVGAVLVNGQVEIEARN